MADAIAVSVADGPDDEITILYIETTRIIAKVTFEQARELFGLGGTPDESVGAHIGALAHYNSDLLARLGPYATEELPVSRTLQKIGDPWAVD